MVNFTTVACRISSRLKRYKNCKNRLRLAKVILKNKLPRFFLVHCVVAVKRKLLPSSSRVTAAVSSLQTVASCSANSCGMSSATRTWNSGWNASSTERATTTGDWRRQRDTSTTTSSHRMHPDRWSRLHRLDARYGRIRFAESGFS